MSTQAPIDYFVEIVESAQDGRPEKVHKRLGPYIKSVAERISRGSNLDHKRFFTRIVEEKRKPEPVP